MRFSYLVAFAFLSIAAPSRMEAQQARGTLIVEVRSGGRPVEQADVLAGEQVAITDANGEAVLQLPPGNVELRVQRFGFTPQTVQASVAADATTRITVQLEAEPIREEITVTATRTEVRMEDAPLRVRRRARLRHPRRHAALRLHLRGGGERPPAGRARHGCAGRLRCADHGDHRAGHRPGRRQGGQQGCRRRGGGHRAGQPAASPGGLNARAGSHRDAGP